jgi:hypothetical protein
LAGPTVAGLVAELTVGLAKLVAFFSVLVAVLV